LQQVLCGTAGQIQLMLFWTFDLEI
jgi:hypothetical protein